MLGLRLPGVHNFPLPVDYGERSPLKIQSGVSHRRLRFEGQGISSQHEVKQTLEGYSFTCAQQG